jgi:hypothetical protein
MQYIKSNSNQPPKKLKIKYYNQKLTEYVTKSEGNTSFGMNKVVFETNFWVTQQNFIISIKYISKKFNDTIQS